MDNTIIICLNGKPAEEVAKVDVNLFWKGSGLTGPTLINRNGTHGLITINRARGSGSTLRITHGRIRPRMAGLAFASTRKKKLNTWEHNFSISGTNF